MVPLLRTLLEVEYVAEGVVHAFLLSGLRKNYLAVSESCNRAQALVGVTGFFFHIDERPVAAFFTEQCNIGSASFF